MCYEVSTPIAAITGFPLTYEQPGEKASGVR
jgi:hypothetical protein